MTPWPCLKRQRWPLECCVMKPWLFVLLSISGLFVFLYLMSLIGARIDN